MINAATPLSNDDLANLEQLLAAYIASLDRFNAPTTRYYTRQKLQTALVQHAPQLLEIARSRKLEPDTPKIQPAKKAIQPDASTP